MADIQSATAEIRRGKKKEEEDRYIEEETTGQKYNGPAIKKKETGRKYNVRICYAGRS